MWRLASLAPAPRREELKRRRIADRVYPDRPTADPTTKRVNERLADPADSRWLIGAPGEHYFDVRAASGLCGSKADARHGRRDRNGDGRQRGGAAGQQSGTPGPVAPSYRPAGSARTVGAHTTMLAARPRARVTVARQAAA